MTSAFVICTLAVAVLVIPAAEVNARLKPVLVPLRLVESSSLIVTAPAELNVNEPNWKLSPTIVPTVIDVPLRLALFAQVGHHSTLQHGAFDCQRIFPDVIVPQARAAAIEDCV